MLGFVDTRTVFTLVAFSPACTPALPLRSSLPSLLHTPPAHPEYFAAEEIATVPTRRSVGRERALPRRGRC